MTAFLFKLVCCKFKILKLDNNEKNIPIDCFMLFYK